MLKEIALEHDDLELYKFACEFEKEAGLLSAVKTTGDGIVQSLFNNGAKNAANVLGKDVSEATKEGAGKLLSKLKPINKPIVPRRAISGGGPFAVSQKCTNY